MAEEGQVIRGINWQETFPFLNIFRAFRIAVHPSKLLFGLILLLLLCLGGSVLDSIWPYRSCALPGEIAMSAVYRQENRDLADWRTQMLNADDAEYAQRLLAANVPAGVTRDQAMDAAPERAHLKELQDSIKTHYFHDRMATLDTAYENAQKLAHSAHDASPGPEADKRLKEDLDAARDRHDSGVREAYAQAAGELNELSACKYTGLWSALFDYEVNQVTNTVRAAIEGHWLNGGVLHDVVNFAVAGPLWLVRYHTVYFVLYGIWFLSVWSIFGGAIARVAAVHVARDEKVSVRQALNFAVGKFLSFSSAPVIPMVIVVIAGLLVAIGAAIGYIPYLGPIVIGAFWGVALLAGCVMTFVLLGTLAGFNLMYPTIAVEGSDSFDAISRSFSYVYARPWRMLFYSAVALVYGAVCYLFVHMFLWVMLMLTHHAASAGLGLAHADSMQPLMSVMWPGPSQTGQLTYTLDTLPLNWGQKVGAALIWVWVYLVVAVLGAFAISFYFSANTIIYALMRYEVDATELDDVYIEIIEERFAEGPAEGSGEPAAPAPETAGNGPAADAPAENPPAGETPAGDATAKPDP
jgi:hypothetical protein